MAERKGEQKVSHADVERLLGEIGDHKVAEIVAIGATIAELERAAAYLAQQTQVMGELEMPLTGRAGIIYEMIRRDEEQLEEER